MQNSSKEIAISFGRATQLFDKWNQVMSRSQFFFHWVRWELRRGREVFGEVCNIHPDAMSVPENMVPVYVICAYVLDKKKKGRWIEIEEEYDTSREKKCCFYSKEGEMKDIIRDWERKRDERYQWRLKYERKGKDGINNNYFAKLKINSNLQRKKERKDLRY